jgi:transposase-like protein
MFGELELETPRDRQTTFDPKIVAKGQTRVTGFDDKIISMYARGMTTREIQGHLEEIYGIEVSPTLISNVTDAVIAHQVRSGDGEGPSGGGKAAAGLRRLLTATSCWCGTQDDGY